MNFWDYVKILWPIASVLTPVLIGIAMLWLRSQFALKTELASKVDRIDGDISNLGKRLDSKNALQDASIIDHETRLKLLEQECQTPPSRHALAIEMSEVKARLSGVETSVKGISKQLGTTNDYLQAIVETGLRK